MIAERAHRDFHGQVLVLHARERAQLLHRQQERGAVHRMQARLCRRALWQRHHCGKPTAMLERQPASHHAVLPVCQLGARVSSAD